MKNVYLSIEEYQRYIRMFNLNEEEHKEVEKIIAKVWKILILKRETPQRSPTKYLKPIMLPEDYRKINRVLNIQLEFKFDRMVKLEQDKLKAQGYSGEKLNQELEKYKKQLRKDLGLRKEKSKNNVEDEWENADDFTFEDFKKMKNL